MVKEKFNNLKEINFKNQPNLVTNIEVLTNFMKFYDNKIDQIKTFIEEETSKNVIVTDRQYLCAFRCKQQAKKAKLQEYLKRLQKKDWEKPK